MVREKAPVLMRAPIKNSFRLLWIAILVCGASSCAQALLQPITHNADRTLAPPVRILVYDFAVNGAAINEYQGILRQQPSIRNARERQQAIAKTVSDTLASDLAGGLRRMGFTVERARRGTAPGKNDLVIDGRLQVVDEGSPLRRMVFGFGSGAAKLETRVRVIGAGERKTLLEFSTRADSGLLPGAAVTLPTAAALPAGLSLGVTAASAVAKGVNESSSDIARLAATSAEQTIRYLSEFFGRQDWLRSTPGNLPRARS